MGKLKIETYKLRASYDQFASRHGTRSLHGRKTKYSLSIDTLEPKQQSLRDLSEALIVAEGNKNKVHRRHRHLSVAPAIGYGLYISRCSIKRLCTGTFWALVITTRSQIPISVVVKKKALGVYQPQDTIQQQC